ncbi:MAG TPA: serine/threonine-protein kinase, partial [Pyrinomonadaceae bacterium]|nr:serine/threonine-protein kinase [Pyrinomonadaceae bacterium]
MKFCQRDGEVLEDSTDEMVGQVLDGQYQVESFLARGGMGTLYRASHIILGDRVVIKTLKPEMRNNAEWLRRFQREGRAARRFRHPNAVTVYDLRTTADGLTYMVMEYVEGESLDKELRRRGRFSPAEALEILSPVASVLEEAHEQGVVHRDLKPENVMVERAADDGELCVKLLDLGIAKLHDVAETQMGDGRPALTMAGQLLGTPYYMSPEQWGEMPQDGGAEVDGRADIYSLGVIFYELISGQKPFTGASLAELRQAHVSRLAPRLDEIADGVPEAFGRAVERALSKDRGARPTTAGEFIAELRAALGLAADVHVTVPVKPHATAPPDFESSQTLIRDNVLATNAPRAATADAQHDAQRNAQPAAAVAVAHQPTAQSQPQTSSVSQAVSARGSNSSSTLKLIAVAAFVLLLVGGIAAGGWFAWSRVQARRVGVAENGGVGVAGRTADATPARVEVLSYWLEAFDDAA